MSVKRNLIYNSLLSASQLLYPIVTFPYVSRILGPSGIGTYNFVESVTRYFILIAALGTPIYGVRKIASLYNSKKEQDSAFREIFTINLLMTISCCLIYFLIIRLMPGFSSHYNLYLIGIIYILSNGLTSEWYFIGREDFKYLFYRTIFVRVVMMVSVFVFIKTVDDVEVYFLINTISFLVLGISNLFYVQKIIKGRIISNFELNSFKQHLRPLVFIFSSIFAVSVYIIFDTIILRLFTNDIIVGYYTAATKLNKVILTFLGAISTVLLPKLSSAFTNNDKKGAEIYLEKSLQLIFSICLPAIFFTFCLSKELIILFSGDQYLAAVPAMKILTPIILIIGLTNVFGLQILNSLGRDKEFLKSVLLGAGISLLLNLVLIPDFGLIGAAISNLSAEATVLVLVFFYSRKEVRFSLSIIAFLSSLISSVIFVPVTLILRCYISSPIIIVISSLTIGGFFYIIINLILGNTIMKSMLNQIFKIIR